QMVLTCSRSSDATPRGNASWNCWPADGAGGASAVSASTSAGLAVCGGPGDRVAVLEGLAAGGSGQHRGLVPWAWIMAAETTSDAAIASHRPPPLVNTFTPTTGSLTVVCDAWGDVRRTLLSPADPTRGKSRRRFVQTNVTVWAPAEAGKQRTSASRAGEIE